MLKVFLRSELGIRITAWVLGAYIRLLTGTIRLERRIDPDAADLLEAGTPFLGVFWHNRLGLIAAAWERGKPVAMVQSEHGDSRILGSALSGYVTRPIFGSTRRNPMGALRGMMRAIEDGFVVALTPDGPRGPRMRCHIGVIEAARQTGVPVVPVAWSTRPRIVAGSWDRFLIPLPFTRGVLIFGAPLLIPPERADRETSRKLLEDALTAVTDQADRLVGSEPIQPAPETNRETRR